VEPTPPLPRVLADLRELPTGPGVAWKLAEPGRQLDANVVRLAPGEQVAPHAEPELDVLVVVLSGGGSLHSDEGERPLAEGALLWLPRGSRRGFTAGPAGLSYVTAHRRRPGMRIGSGPDFGRAE